jgi:hypothetical protein
MYAICAVMFTIPLPGMTAGESSLGPLLGIFLPTGYVPFAAPEKTSFHRSEIKTTGVIKRYKNFEEIRYFWFFYVKKQFST